VLDVRKGLHIISLRDKVGQKLKRFPGREIEKIEKKEEEETSIEIRAQQARACARDPRIIRHFVTVGGQRNVSRYEEKEAC